MSGRALVLGVAVIAAAVAAAIATGLPIPLRRAPGDGETARVAAGVVDDSAAAADTSGTVGTGGTGGRPPGGDTAAPDTVPRRLPHPEIMLGTWHHGDARSRYGDSLVMVLRGNGSASATERRWTLDDTGWHVERVNREGTWTLRYRGTTRMDLCTEWVTPRETGGCERIVLTEDSVRTDSLRRDTLVMEYAGRHWRRATAREEEAAARRPRRAG